MDKARISGLISQYRDGLLHDTVPFWTRHATDRESGGFQTFLDRDGSVFGPDKPVWLQGRIVWMYARLYNEVERRPEWLELALHGADFLLKHCFDSDHRAFFLVTREGRPLRKRRYLFSEIFAAMGFAELAVATEDESWRRRAADLFDLILKYYRTPGLLDPKVNADVRPTRGHTMPMILLGLTQVLRRSEERSIYRETADRSLEEVLGLFCKPELKALLELVGPQGEFLEDLPEGRTVLPGHAIESAWFIMEEGRLREQRDLSLRGVQILEWALGMGWDRQFGGLLYYVDVLGKPSLEYQWDMKLWWPHTEAVYATLLAYVLTGDPKWSEWHRIVHEYAFSHFPDPEYGEWFGYLHRDGTVSHYLKGNLWKGPYHLSRMQLLSWKLLEQIEG